MPLDYSRIRKRVFPDVVQAYTSKDAMLYALAVAYGQDPCDPRQLRFVYEQNQLVAPTFPVVLGYPGFWMREPDVGIDWARLLHVGQSLRLMGPLPSAGKVIGRTRVKAVIDKGLEKGAIVVQEREIIDASTGRTLAIVEQSTLCRSEGGLGGGDSAPEAPPPMPDRAADAVIDVATPVQAALLYRLCADPNPVHADPELARRAGFPKPILHGLCTFGGVAQAVLRAVCDWDPSRLSEISARFSMHVYPGETLRTEMWQSGGNLMFRTRTLERNVIVLDHGMARIL